MKNTNLLWIVPLMVLSGFFLGFVFLDGNFNINMDDNTRMAFENFTSSIDNLYTLDLYEDLLTCKEEMYQLATLSYETNTQEPIILLQSDCQSGLNGLGEAVWLCHIDKIPTSQ